MFSNTPPFFQHLLDYVPFSEAVVALWSGKSISVDGVHGGVCALAAVAIRQSGNKPITLLTATTEQAEQIIDDLELFLPTAKNLLFPALEHQTFVPDAENIVFALADDLFGQRIRVLKQLSENLCSQITIVVPILSLLQQVPPKEFLIERTQLLQVGKQIDLIQLRQSLIESGYHATPAIDLPGEFSVRGSIFDLFAPDWKQPVRIEFFDDEIESIRCFDIVTQRSLEHVNQIDLTRLLPNEAVGASLLDYLPPTSPIILVEPREIELAAQRFHDNN
ncbi:MAG: hypothetical protein LBI18_02940 [Planctomycetaceae bacterium]|jgi:transcription-repair coupling factor (superfamily II helicase)|nr:hypothetical protein [Planctomycetaceae bacterium]